MQRKTNHSEIRSSHHEEAEFAASYEQEIPYSHPLWIKLSALFIAIAWLWIVPRIIMEIPDHKNLYHIYQDARAAFKKEEYTEALGHYQKIFAKQPQCKEARMRLAEIFFIAAKSAEASNFNFYDTAIFYLGNLKYSKEELLEVQSYLSYSQLKLFQKHMKTLPK